MNKAQLNCLRRFGESTITDSSGKACTSCHNYTDIW